VIGLLGGIAAGKSTVARLFGELGWVVIDADEIARSVSERPAVAREIGRRLGPDVLAAGERVDRRRLADRVFGDPAALAELEAILHPPVRAEIEERMARAAAAGRAVVLDVPLLLEGGLIEQCDHVVFIDAPRAERLRRARDRGWSDAEIVRRERAQADLDVKQAAAHHILRAHTFEDTRLQVRDIHSRITS
jgi:dephospho-CoA kinase